MKYHHKIILVHSPDAAGVESRAIDIFSRRLVDLAPATRLILCTDLSSVEVSSSSPGELVILAGAVPNGAWLLPTLATFNLRPPILPESFLLHYAIDSFTPHSPASGHLQGSSTRLLRGGSTLNLPLVILGADGPGLLYGLGSLLRQMQFEGGQVRIDPLHEASSPVIQDRGVYFATHFNNFCERAPLEKICHYIEELALWGFNLLFFWFDMNWFPYGFWEQPGSPGMNMIHRLSVISETARACGMRVGGTAIANEGFSFQPPPELRADISVRRGGFYPYSQICPSRPGGLDLIIANRRKVLELLGPLDYYWYWPYDQGGCGCAQCSEEIHPQVQGKMGKRWGRKFLELGAMTSQVVKEYHPNIKFLVSTWLMDEVERGMGYDLCRQGQSWLDGLLLETKDVTEFDLPAPYFKQVFPEISMFDCYYTSYGCNGANPAPQRFTLEARQIAAAGCGAVLYSEGMYEDINKAIWASLLWSPQRQPRQVLDGYCGYYFGAQHRAAVVDLVEAMEGTWGARRLLQTPEPQARRLFETAGSIQAGLQLTPWSHDSWQVLRDRLEMDGCMARLGSQTALLRASRLLFEEACSTSDLPGLRQNTVDIVGQLRERHALLAQFFELYWRYLRDYHLTRTELIFIPDDVIGKMNLQPLQTDLENALAFTGPEEFREQVVKAFKKWFWCSGIDIDYLFI
jgi:hypothetical protein